MLSPFLISTDDDAILVSSSVKRSSCRQVGSDLEI